MRLAGVLGKSIKWAGLLFGVSLLAASIAVAKLLLRGEWQIAKLLPQAEPDFVCFTGTFSKRSMDLEDWGRSQLQPTGRLSPDGKPIMRNVPVREDNIGVRSFTLRLDYDDRKADYDWIYNFRLLAHMDKMDPLHAVGECPWYEKDFFDAQTKWGMRATTSTLYCGIDCDGGMMHVSRIPGTRAVHLSFDRQIGLRMKKGCGGGGSTYRVLANDTGGDFRLEPAPKTACANLKPGED